MYSVSLRGVCMCVFFQGDLRGYLAQQDWKFRNADSLELQRMGCEIAAGVTHLHKHNFLHRYDTSDATRSKPAATVLSNNLRLDKTKCQHITSLLSFKLILIFRCPVSLGFR